MKTRLIISNELVDYLYERLGEEIDRYTICPTNLYCPLSLKEPGIFIQKWIKDKVVLPVGCSSESVPFDFLVEKEKNKGNTVHLFLHDDTLFKKDFNLVGLLKNLSEEMQERFIRDENKEKNRKQKKMWHKLWDTPQLFQYSAVSQLKDEEKNLWFSGMNSVNNLNNYFLVFKKFANKIYKFSTQIKVTKKHFLKLVDILEKTDGTMDDFFAKLNMDKHYSDIQVMAYKDSYRIHFRDVNDEVDYTFYIYDAEIPLFSLKIQEGVNTTSVCDVVKEINEAIRKKRLKKTIKVQLTPVDIIFHLSKNNVNFSFRYIWAIKLTQQLLKDILVYMEAVENDTPNKEEMKEELGKKLVMQFDSSVYIEVDERAFRG